ncbi:MAG TPA: hypothetical protein VFV30_01615 [Novosphingobium sp.]|nr:hypothetical protein [Novosphingobium sp.]
MPALRAGLAYWGLIFALGFALGTVRTLWLAPAVGPLAAVGIELPIMLGASLWLARRLIRRHGITASAEALVMSGTAFALLLISEAALARLLGGQSLADWAADLASPPGALGLAGQIAFALLPLVLVRRAPRGG